MSATTSAHGEAWQAWQSHSKGERQDTGLTFACILRKSHENHHVIRVDVDSCDLQGFAAAGFATWTDEDSQLYDAKRAFADPGSRIEKGPGSLSDTVHFGRAQYEWQGKNFIVYTTVFTENWVHGPLKAMFILAPRGDKIVDNHHIDIDALLLACGNWTKELHGEIFVFDQARWSKSKDLYKSVENSSWDDVILHPDTKSKLIEDIQGFFENRELYRSFGIPWKRGVILHGVPGNGKTISIKAIINNLSKREAEPVPSLYVKSLDHCSGPKYSIQSIFSMARQMAPCILIFEDLDSMVTEKVRSYFLNEIDGLESNDGILMIGSTNHLDRLDPAIAKRPSRFDRKYHFKLPEEDERVLYCQYWYRKLLNHPLVAFPEDMCPIIAKLTEGFSFAYLKELYITSLLILARGSTSEDTLQPCSSDHSSILDTFVVEGPSEEEIGTEPEPASDKGKEGSNSTKSRKPKIKRVIPTIEIFEELQGNTLLSVMMAQAQALLDEMDNSEDELAAKSQVCQPEPWNMTAAC